MSTNTVCDLQIIVTTIGFFVSNCENANMYIYTSMCYLKGNELCGFGVKNKFSICSIN